MGTTNFHARHARHLRHDFIKIRELRISRLEKDMAIDADDLVQQFLVKTIHHRHDDDQRRNTEDDPQERKKRDHRNEARFAAGAKVAERNHPFKGREWAGSLRRVHHEPAIRAMTAAASRFSRAPVARVLSSTVPEASPFGPTMI